VTVTEIISQVLSYTDNLPATDADYADRRLRLLNYLREVLAGVWYKRDWPFARRSAQLTVGAGDGYVNVPTDFLKIGDYGSVLLEADQTGDPLENVPEYRVHQSRRTNLVTNTPGFFSIFDIDPTTFVQRLQFPMNDIAYDVILEYIKDAPTIDEGANNTAISQLPVQYHQRVLVPGLQARSLQSKGDASWNTYEGRYLEAIAEMKYLERRLQGTIWQLPPFFRRFGRHS
jgi:hypothetical protein